MTFGQIGPPALPGIASLTDVAVSSGAVALQAQNPGGTINLLRGSVVGATGGLLGQAGSILSASGTTISALSGTALDTAGQATSGGATYYSGGIGLFAHGGGSVITSDGDVLVAAVRLGTNPADPATYGKPVTAAGALAGAGAYVASGTGNIGAVLAQTNGRVWLNVDAATGLATGRSGTITVLGDAADGVAINYGLQANGDRVQHRRRQRVDRDPRNQRVRRAGVGGRVGGSDPRRRPDHHHPAPTGAGSTRPTPIRASMRAAWA